MSQVLETTAPATDVDSIKRLIAKDFSAVDELLKQRLHSDIVLINQLSHYIIVGGGKRLRPVIALLSARAAGYHGDKHVNCAAIIELIHTATLLHDDVVDESDMRRGRETANLIWGNPASVLVGDFLYSRSFQMMVEISNLRVLEILSDATNVIAEGEVLQLMNCHDPDISEHRYLETIRQKTAKLFEAAAALGVVLAGGDTATEASMAAYGRHLGTAFQLVDDVLDYSSDDQTLGKQVGDDLAEGKPTLPLLYALWNGSADQAAVIREAVENGGRDKMQEILKAIESTGAIAYTSRLARIEADAAKAALMVMPPSEFRDALAGLADFAVTRSS